MFTLKVGNPAFDIVVFTELIFLLRLHLLASFFVTAFKTDIKMMTMRIIRSKERERELRKKKGQVRITLWGFALVTTHLQSYSYTLVKEQ